MRANVLLIAENRTTYSPIEPNRKNFGGIAKVADLGALLEVTHPEGPGGGLRHNGHQAAGKQALGDVHFFSA
jgi:hypothetical protein